MYRPQTAFYKIVQTTQLIQKRSCRLSRVVSVKCFTQICLASHSTVFMASSDVHTPVRVAKEKLDSEVCSLMILVLYSVQMIVKMAPNLNL